MPLADALAARHRVLLPDLPGYGASPPLEDASFERIAAALIAMLRDRGIVSLAGIVGFSGGAYRAFDLVLERGVRVRRVIGLGALATLDEPTREAFRGLAEAIDADPDVLRGESHRAIMASACCRRAGVLPIPLTSTRSPTGSR